MKTVSKTSVFTLKKNRKFKIFLFFLVLTSILWLIIQLSKTYTNTATFHVEYENLPNDKLLQESPISELDIVIKAPGFTQLKYQLKQGEIKLKLNATASKNNKIYYLLPNNQLAYLNQQINDDLEVLHILRDTIFVEYGNNISKKVPIDPDIDIKFKLGYNFIENLKIVPDSVTVTGPEKYIDTLSAIKTNSLRLEDVYDNVNTELALRTPQNNDKIHLSVEKVNAIGKVDKFTEGNFMLPVVIINQPEDVKINPFPKNVKVIYQVGLSNFNKINEDSFSVVYDYNQFRKDTLTRYLKPILTKKSELIYSVKIVPSQIEFLIQK